MRDIADIHERITRAFTSTAAASEAESTVEHVVSPVADGSDTSGHAISRLFDRMVAWRRRRTVPGLRFALKEAEVASAAKSRQIATVVHEIRTPLNGILGMTHLLGQTKLTAEQQNYLSAIRQSGYALSQLVEDLLDYATLEAGRFKLNNRAENLRQLIESVVELLAPRAHEKRIEIAATVEACVPDLLDFDPARIRQVLFNVIGNAVKFTAEGGVLVKASLDGEDIAIAVIDSGPGMTLDEQRSIFGEFEQAGTAETRSGGTGLGLGIASRILAEFGGSLSVASTKGKGTTFTVRFPRQLPDSNRAGTAVRNGLLSKSQVLLLAPDGPAAHATVATIETLGGRCRYVWNPSEAQMLIDRAAQGPMPYTDLIVDHRLASDYANEKAHSRLHRILLVNPEERASQPQDFFDAWLIRPLREKSLIDVLSGRLRGFGTRDTLTETPPLAPTRIVTTKDEGFDILVGEDDPVNALLLRTVLGRAGHRVTHVDNFSDLTKTALDPSSRFDLIVSDMHMPGGELGDFLISYRKEMQAPVMVLTGEGTESARREALLKGADRVFMKPIEPAKLLQEIKTLADSAVDRLRLR